MNIREIWTCWKKNLNVRTEQEKGNQKIELFSFGFQKVLKMQASVIFHLYINTPLLFLVKQLCLPMSTYFLAGNASGDEMHERNVTLKTLFTAGA